MRCALIFAELLLCALPCACQRSGVARPSSQPAATAARNAACVFDDVAPPVDYLPVGARFPTPIPIPHGSHLLFIGDSLMRYQYMSLVYTLHTRSNLAFAGRAARNPLMEGTWTNFYDFYNGTTKDLRGDEFCDCHRPKGGFSRAVARRTVENRHFFWRIAATRGAEPVECDVTVSYVQHFKADDNV